MRLGGGFSFGGRGVRAGVSRSGRFWLGARAPIAGPAYLTASEGGGGGGGGSIHSVRGSTPHASSALSFTVTDDGRVFIGATEVDLDDLRTVVEAADAAKAER